MFIAFMLDENLRGPLWHAIQQHNARGINPIDAARVGDPFVLPLGSTDPEVLAWAERERRIVVSEDKRTMPGHVLDHLAAGHYCPGVMIVPRGTAIKPVVDFLVIAAYASDISDWENQYKYIL